MTVIECSINQKKYNIASYAIFFFKKVIPVTPNPGTPKLYVKKRYTISKFCTTN